MEKVRLKFGRSVYSDLLFSNDVVGVVDVQPVRLEIEHTSGLFSDLIPRALGAEADLELINNDTGEQVLLNPRLKNGLKRVIEHPPFFRANIWDCRAFVETVFGMNYSPARFGDWSILPEERGDEGFKNGEAVFIKESDNYIQDGSYHFGLKIANNSYLSKFGIAGPLAVSSFGEMLRIFNGETYRAIPLN